MKKEVELLEKEGVEGFLDLEEGWLIKNCS